jgi:PAS domain-containing protein
MTGLLPGFDPPQSYSLSPAEMASRDQLSWMECTAASDCSEWNPSVRRFFEYWLSIAPAGQLPGRQHFDPLDIAAIMPRVWILDVVHEPPGPRFRYRLVGTKEVETLQREVTGQWLDEVQPHLRDRPGGFERFFYMVEHGRATYRTGRVSFMHHRDHRIVENCMAPLARDGQTVDMIAVCSVLYRLDGKES